MKRTDIIKLAQAINPSGMVVEVGVKYADFSYQIAKTYKNCHLYMVDPYVHFPKEVYQEIGNYHQDKQNKIYTKAWQKMLPFKDKSTFVRKTSEDAVRGFVDDSLSLVYIDANHAYDYVKQDFLMWYPKVKPGGIIAGHDFYNSNVLNICGVKKLITEVCQENNFQLIVTNEIIKSWVIIKPYERT